MAVALHAFSDIPTATWITLLNHPDVVRHMPLAEAHWTEGDVEKWAKAKDAQWQLNGYGPNAILVDGHFAGWGGFQREEGGADFALVLLPRYWGHGAEIFRSFMRCRAALGVGTVSILVPPTRFRTRGLARLGFLFDRELDYQGHRFLKFRFGG